MNGQESKIEKDSLVENAEDVFVRLRRRIKEIRGDDRVKADPEALAKKLAKRAEVWRGRIVRSEPAGPEISFLAFSNGPQRYGIPVSGIIRVQPLREYTPVPGAPSFVTGVLHWRGAIIALIDLVKLFGIAESGLIDERICMIVEAAGRRMGILAGQLDDLETVPLDQLKSAPELAANIPPEWIMGVYDENRLILRIEQIVQDERVTNWRKTTL